MACIPGALAGVLFDDVIESYIREPWIVAIALAVMGIIMFVVDKYAKKDNTIEKLTFKQAILIGVGQMFALVPGFSRSGTTMTVARALKLDRESATKFSFLLGAPVMFGAAVFAIKKITPDMLDLSFFLGIAVSFVVGMLAIKVLMNIVKKVGFEWFAIYRIALALVIIAVYFVR